MENQWWKKLRIDNCNEEDCISKLPHNILCSILSSLPVKEGVRASVLSSKWKHISSNPIDLTFDAENILKRDHSAINVWHQSKEQRLEYKRKRTSAFVSNVKKYLSHVEQVQKIDKLKVCFTFCQNGNGSTDLDEWIRFATQRNVEVIDLSLLEDTHNQQSANTNDGSLHVFPCDIVGNEGASSSNGFKSYLKCLRLTHCVLAPYKSYNSGFSALTTMELYKVDLKSEEHIQNLLASCNNLEWLGFSECYNMDHLIIKHPFCQKLKCLNVNLCHQLKALVIHNKSLGTLEYKGNKIEFVFDAPRLKTFYSPISDSTACHRDIWPVFRLPIDLPQTETLMMECSCYMGQVMAKRLPLITFKSLMHLQVIKVAKHRQDLWWVDRILKACPVLRRLELHLRTYLCIEEELRSMRPPTCPHSNLKEVVITGIRGLSSEIEIALYLLKNTIALEKMTIDPRPKNYLGNGKWDYSEACEDWNKEVKEKVHKILKQEADSAVELLIK